MALQSVGKLKKNEKGTLVTVVSGDKLKAFARMVVTAVKEGKAVLFTVNNSQYGIGMSAGAVEPRQRQQQPPPAQSDPLADILGGTSSGTQSQPASNPPAKSSEFDGLF